MLVSFLHRAVMQGIPLLYGSTGEILTEKSGNLNLGIPGIMYVGGISGVIGAFIYENSLENKADANGFLAIIIPLLSCLLGSLIMGLIYSFLTTTLRANQNVTGLALTTFGVGFGNFFGGSLIKITGSAVPSITLTVTSSFYSKTLPFASKLGWFGEVFLNYSFLAYFAIICAVVVSVVLNKTRVGLSLRAVGENPATADAAGINVNKNKYFATCIGSMIAGLGGLYYVMDYATGIWSNDAFGDRGWLAIALVIFTVWRPNLSIFGSILFGGLYIVHNYLNDIVPNMTMSKQEIIKIAPYLVTIIVLIAISTRKKRETQPPASLGLSYFREER
ncbi:MAG TPA: ABC transporter permease [Ruminococcaceae bacterium]|nr:ABC transporter permease [Oscillospiraceae bacterium]